MNNTQTDPRQKAIDDINEEIAARQKMLAVLPLIPNHPAITGISPCMDWLSVYLPANWPVFLEIKAQLGADFEVLYDTASHQSTSGAFSVVMRHKDTGLDIHFHLDTTKEGATCRLEQIGVDEKPVYRIVCQ
jgi:hypothetical protein